MLQIWKLHSNPCCLWPAWSTFKICLRTAANTTQQPGTGVFFWRQRTRLPLCRSRYRRRVFKLPLAVKRRDTGSLALYLCVLISPTQSLLISTDPPEKEAVLSSATQACFSSPRRLNCLHAQLFHLLSGPPRQWEQLLTQRLLLWFNISKQFCIFTHLTNVFSWILTAVMLDIYLYTVYVCLYFIFKIRWVVWELLTSHHVAHFQFGQNRNVPRDNKLRGMQHRWTCIPFKGGNTHFLEWYLLSESKINSTGKRQMCAEGFRSKWTARCPPLLRGVLFLGGEGRIQQDALIKPCPPPFPKTKEGEGLGVIRSLSTVSSPLTWPSSSWSSPSWRWRRANPTCLGGGGVFWRGVGWGCSSGGLVACSCRPSLRCGRRCGCFSQRWMLSIPDRLLHPAASPKQNPTEQRRAHGEHF